MTYANDRRAGLGLILAAAIDGARTVAAPTPAHAINTGEASGIGLSPGWRSAALSHRVLLDLDPYFAQCFRAQVEAEACTLAHITAVRSMATTGHLQEVVHNPADLHIANREVWGQALRGEH